MSGSRFFGYWIAVTDEDSARDAVRMSGLPVLLMGASSALLALILAVRPLPEPVMIGILAAVAILLILLAFRVRAGHAAWMPIVLMLFGAFLITNAVSSWVGWRLAGTSGAQLLLGWFMPVVCLILVLGGFRGWRWMRANAVKASY